VPPGSKRRGEAKEWLKISAGRYPALRDQGLLDGDGRDDLSVWVREMAPANDLRGKGYPRLPARFVNLYQDLVLIALGVAYIQ
jgi:hypothetical protein